MSGSNCSALLLLSALLPPPMLVFLVYFDFSPQTGSGSSRIGRKERVAVAFGALAAYVYGGVSTPRKISCLADVSVLTPWGRAKRVNNDHVGGLLPLARVLRFYHRRTWSLRLFCSGEDFCQADKVSGDASCRAFRRTAARKFESAYPRIKPAVVRSQEAKPHSRFAFYANFISSLKEFTFGEARGKAFAF